MRYMCYNNTKEDSLFVIELFFVYNIPVQQS